MTPIKLKLSCLSFLLPAFCFAAPQWPQFRGPDGTGIAEKERPPIHFGPGSNELWKVSMPTGASSPCVWGNSIFLTAFNEGKLETICIDRKSGNLKWQHTAPSEKIEKYHATEGSPASATPATDGKNVVSYFGSCGLFCYDFAGKEKWRLDLPTAEQAGDFGSGTSPVIAGKLVLLNHDQLKGAELLAVDITTGKVVWRADRNELGTSFGSPAIWKNGRDQEVVLPGHLEMRAYSVKDGAERWRVSGMPSAVCTTPVAGDNLLFFAGWSPGKDTPMPTFEILAASEDKNKDGVIDYDEASTQMQNFFASYDQNRDKRLTKEEWNAFREVLMKGENSLIAIRPGGKGNITESHIAWKQTRGLPYVPSPLYYRGNIYLVKDGGMMSCFNAKTGDPVYQQERIGAVGSYYASPVAADGRIYVASVNGVLSVVKAGEKPDVIGRADFKERFVATPALVDNKIYVRTADHLWAFGK